MEKERNRRLRFTFDDETLLLREIVSHNPLVNPELWEVVQRNLARATGKLFIIRTLKQHLQLLLQLWLKNDRETRIRSGEEEPYSERDVLLQEISTINENLSCVAKGNKALKEKKNGIIGRELREQFAVAFQDVQDFHAETDVETNCEMVYEEKLDVLQHPLVAVIQEEHDYYIPSTNEPEPTTNYTETSKRTLPERNVTPATSRGSRRILEPVRRRINRNKTLKKDALSYLGDKNERESHIREKELLLEERKVVIEERRLDMEERRLVLQERAFEVDKAERLQKLEFENQRIEIEFSERKTVANLIQCQQKIIDSLMNRLSTEHK